MLATLDKHGLLVGGAEVDESEAEALDDDALLAELGIDDDSDTNISALKQVKPRAEIRAAEEIANRIPCADFAVFRPLFVAVQDDIDRGVRKTLRFAKDASIKLGEYFILGGQMAYVAQVGEEVANNYDRPDCRLRVIYDNGTESDILMRSLQRGLYKDEAGRRITDPVAGPLFGNVLDEDDIGSGTIYVLRSQSEHPHIAKHRDVLHKIGVTGGDVARAAPSAARIIKIKQPSAQGAASSANG